MLVSSQRGVGEYREHLIWSSRLSPGINSLEDVIVIGYGTQKQLSTRLCSQGKGRATGRCARRQHFELAARAVLPVSSRAPMAADPVRTMLPLYIRGVATTGTTVNGVTYTTTLIVVDGVIRIISMK